LFFSTYEVSEDFSERVVENEYSRQRRILGKIDEKHRPSRASLKPICPEIFFDFQKGGCIVIP